MPRLIDVHEREIWIDTKRSWIGGVVVVNLGVLGRTFSRSSNLPIARLVGPR